MTDTTSPTDHTAHPARTSERGAAVVEFAIVVVPLIMIVLGIVEFGRIYSLQLSMQYAAREAARTVALKYDDSGMTPGLLDGLVDETLVDLLPGIDDLTDLGTMSVLVDGCTVGVADDRAEVELTRDVDLAIPFVDVSSLESISARSEMPCEG